MKSIIALLVEKIRGGFCRAARLPHGAHDGILHGRFRREMDREQKMQMLLDQIWEAAIDKHKELNVAGVSPCDARRVLFVSPAVAELAGELCVNTIFGLRIVPLENGKS